MGGVSDSTGSREGPARARQERKGPGILESHHSTSTTSPLPTDPAQVVTREVPAARHRTLVVIAALSVILVAGITLRAVSMARANWMIDGDEATFGLMARHILQGERPIFLYGQPYMGSLQAYFGAVSFTLFGMSRVAFKLVTFPEFLAFAASVYLLARRVAGTRATLIATLLAAIPPVYVVSATARLWGPLLDTMTLGNLLLLLVIDEVYPPQVLPPRRTWLRGLVMGLLVGFGFWLHGQILVYAATAAILLLMKHRLRALRPVLLVPALLGFVVGAGPIWAFARNHDYTTFHYVLGLGGERPDIDYWEVTTYLMRINVPRVLGLGNPWAPLPIWLKVPGAIAIGALLLALVVRRRWGIVDWARFSVRRGAPEDALLLFSGLLLLAFVFSNFGDLALHYLELDVTGRYVIPLVSVLPVLLASELVRWQRRSSLLAGSALGIIVVVWLAGYVIASPARIWQSPYWPRLPESNQELVAALDELGVDAVWINHWAGKPLMFDTQERIAAADYYDITVGRGIDRLPDATHRVRATPNAAYVFTTDEQDLPMEAWLQQQGIAYEKRIVPGYVVLHPHTPVDPGEVVQFLGYAW